MGILITYQMCSGGISLCSAYNFANLRESVNIGGGHELEAKAKADEEKKKAEAVVKDAAPKPGGDEAKVADKPHADTADSRWSDTLVCRKARRQELFAVLRRRPNQL